MSNTLFKTPKNTIKHTFNVMEKMEERLEKREVIGRNWCFL